MKLAILSILTVALTIGAPRVVFAEPAPSVAAQSGGTIVLDGQYGDWSGRANIADPQGDAASAAGDIVAFYWGDNPDDSTVYWMVQRPSGQEQAVIYSVRLDMNNDGSFQGSSDRVVRVRADFDDDEADVEVTVLRADNSSVVSSNSDEWDDDGGGARVEFGASHADLGFSFGSAFRMYVESDGNDRAPDSGDVQWSPVPILGYVGAALALAAGVVAIWWFRLRRYGRQEVPRT